MTKGQADKEIRPDRVAIYIRWSTEEQSEGTTLVEQREGCELYVRSQGWFVNPKLVFIDDGYSGGSLDRPGMRQLRDLVQAGEVDCTVVFKIDRLSRNIVDATQLVLVEWNERCHLRCVRQPIDTTSETGRMIFSILATFADFERAQITERTYQGRLRRLQEGKAYGGPSIAFGLLPAGEPGVRQLDPVRAPIVAEMFRKVRDERCSVYDLAAWLDEQGIPPMTGKKWRHNTLRNMLRNPLYAGRIVYGRAKHFKKPGKNSYSQVPRETPLIDVEASTVPAIVSTELFDEVQAILSERSELHKSHKRAFDGLHLLSGIAKCRCGGTMHIHWSRGQRYYICNQRIAYGPNACSVENGVLLADSVEEAVVKDLLTVFGGKQRAAEAAQMVAAQSTREVQALEAELGKLRSELDKVDRRLAELREAAGLGTISLDEWRDLRETLEGKRKAVADSLAAVQQKADRCSAVDREERMLLQRMELLDRWDSLPPAEQKSLLRDLAQEIVLFKPRGNRKPHEVKIVWRYVS